MAVPTQEILSAEFRSEHKQIQVPQVPEDVPEFVESTYSQFLEPIPGSVHLRAYSEEELSRAGIQFQPVKKDRYFDPLHKMDCSQRYDMKDSP